MTVGRDAGPPGDEQTRQVRDLVDLPRNKAEVPKGKVPRRGIKEVNAAPRGYPLYVRNHSRDGPFVAAVDGCGPSLSTSILIPEKIQTRPCQRLLRESSPNQFISQDRANARREQIPLTRRVYIVYMNIVYTSLI